MMTDDIKIKIATAPTRKARKWVNRQTTWAKLVEKCSAEKFVRTRETFAEYTHMSRDEQSDIKDVGGFVGGTLRGGIRKKGNVMERTLVTLDIDFGRPSTWEDFTEQYACAALIYSTHKHTPEKPRYRLVIPLDRAVTPEEYEPIARRIADDIGIETFDHTTYELCRLFFWPSCSKDVEPYFEAQEGQPLCANDVLATYVDWRNVTEWPVSRKEGERVQRDIKKAGDPCEKKGVIGTFCRTYTIEDAIEKFLPNIYEPTAHEGRYTYAGGSSSCGLVCYDHKFAYSHHESDPAGMRLCNAFDLVRIHLYGAMDEGADDTNVKKLPSMNAMTEFALADAGIKRAIINERKEEAANDFDGVNDDEDDTEWEGHLTLNKNKSIESSASNIITILENDKGLKGKFWLNLFDRQINLTGKLPWDRTTEGCWSDDDDKQLRVYIEQRYGISGCKDKIKDCFAHVVAKTQRHPIREYLNGLQWDGVPRLDTLLIDYLGADDTAITRAFTRKAFTAAVARVMKPGVKFDYCLVLTGPEGIGKSLLLSRMAGDGYFNDNVPLDDGKMAGEVLARAWFVEIAELAGYKRSSVEQVKAFLSRTSDIFRPAYGTKAEEFKRHCVFFGTTNEELFLKGDNGNRRFWVVKVNGNGKYEVWRDIIRDRDQLWAEAVIRYRQGEELELTGELREEARRLQSQYNDDADDPMKAQLDAFLEARLPADWSTRSDKRRIAYYHDRDPLDPDAVVERDEMCAVEFLCEFVGKKRDDIKYLTRKVNAMMREKEDWEEVRYINKWVADLYGRQRGFRRISSVTKPVTEDETDEDL